MRVLQRAAPTASCARLDAQIALLDLGKALDIKLTRSDHLHTVNDRTVAQVLTAAGVAPPLRCGRIGSIRRGTARTIASSKEERLASDQVDFARSSYLVRSIAWVRFHARRRSDQAKLEARLPPKVPQQRRRLIRSEEI